MKDKFLDYSKAAVLGAAPVSSGGSANARRTQSADRDSLNAAMEVDMQAWIENRIANSQEKGFTLPTDEEVRTAVSQMIARNTTNVKSPVTGLMVPAYKTRHTGDLEQRMGIRYDYEKGNQVQRAELGRLGIKPDSVLGVITGHTVKAERIDYESIEDVPDKAWIGDGRRGEVRDRINLNTARLLGAMVNDDEAAARGILEEIGWPNAQGAGFQDFKSKVGIKD
jgi:hypothetical protein